MVVAQEPPPSRYYARNINWKKIVSEVKALNGEFANIGEFSPGIAGHIRRGGYAHFLPDGFDGDRKTYMDSHYEVTARSVGQRPQRVQIFVRWKGDDGDRA